MNFSLINPVNIILVLVVALLVCRGEQGVIMA